MDLAQVHETLIKSHQEMMSEPAAGVEGIERASCPPHVKHLAQLASGAASEGYTAARWRAEVLGGLGPDVAPLLRNAEQCMVEAGLWPWQKDDETQGADQPHHREDDQ